MNTLFKLFIFTLVIVAICGFSVQGVSAAQNPNYPTPSQCNDAIWDIGLPDGITCSGTSRISSNDFKSYTTCSIPWNEHLLKPDIATLNKYCQVTYGSNSYAKKAQIHSCCSGTCGNVSWLNNNWNCAWIPAGGQTVSIFIDCSTSCVPSTPTYCANGTTMTATEFNAARTAGKISVTQTSSNNQTIYHINNTTGCSAPLIAASYKVFVQPNNSGWLSTQQFYADSGVVNINSNGNTDVAVSLASCMTQADLWYQTAPHQFTSDVESGWSGYTLIYGGPISSAGLCTSCTPNTTKQCVGNSVYNFDSCGVQGSLYQQCTANQICQNGACVDQNIPCSSNSQCGTDGLVGSPFCQGGNVYKHYTTYTCANPGTPSSSCSNAQTDQLITTCAIGQTCANGSCADNCTANVSKQCFGNAVYYYDSCGNKGDLYKTCTANQACLYGDCVSVRCSNASDCGTTGLTGSTFCQGNSVYQNYTTWTCNSPGTAVSSCSQSSSPQLQSTCNSNQTCTNGACVTNNSNIVVSCYATPNPVNVNQSVSFICNVSGGTGNYTYSWTGACTSNTPTCTTTFSTAGTQTATALVTSGSQTNSASASVTVNQNCAYHSSERCVGNNLYWYDSCGVQQDLSQVCPNGCSNNSCTNNNNVTVQTNAATNVSISQATLNGYLYNTGSNNNCTTYVWFQYGPTSSYGSETTHQSQNYSGAFSQTAYISSGSTYHFRAVAQSCSGSIVYGQDMTTYTSGTGGNLTASKTVRNLSNGSGFSSSASAVPGDMLMFMITLQATGSQDVSSVVARDYLPANLVYNNQLVVACTTNNSNYSNCSGNNYNYTGNIASGVNLNTIYAGQTVTITYQVQVASATNFAYGSTTLNNNVSVSSSNGSNPTSSASVVVTRSAVYGASVISTGLTNNFWVDSFFLPLLLALIGIWMWKSGIFFGIEKWLDNKKKTNRGYKSEKELNARITEIRQLENF